MLDNLRALTGDTAGSATDQHLPEPRSRQAGCSPRSKADCRRPAPANGASSAREEALKRLQAAEGMAEIIASLPRNPLPDAFVVTPAE
jgi:cell division transport system permease protein